MRKTQTTNPQLVELINLLKTKSRENQANIWLDVAELLSKPRSQSVALNLSGINRNTKKNDTIVVPGKILSYGSLDHAVTVAAFSASEGAKAKLAAAKAKFISIQDLVEKNPKGSNIKIIR
jgi:large subunit ribosomal protein L18e